MFPVREKLKTSARLSATFLSALNQAERRLAAPTGDDQGKGALGWIVKSMKSLTFWPPMITMSLPPPVFPAPPLTLAPKPLAMLFFTAADSRKKATGSVVVATAHTGKVAGGVAATPADARVATAGQVLCTPTDTGEITAGNVARAAGDGGPCSSDCV